METVAVRGEAIAYAKALFSAGDYKEYTRGDHCSGDLSQDIGRQLGDGKALGGGESDRDGRIQVAARYMADGVSHRQDSQAKGESHPKKSNAKDRKGGCEHRAAAAGEDEPKGA